MKRTSKAWTPAERAILKSIKYSDRTVKEMTHLLPGRTLIAIKQQMARMPGDAKMRGRSSWVFSAMRRILLQTPGLTNRQLAETIGCTRNGIQDCVRSELGKRLYVSGWCRSGVLWVAQYSIGQMPDVPKPPRQTKLESYALQTAKRHARRNPFAVAAGFTVPMSGVSGHVFRHVAMDDKP